MKPRQFALVVSGALTLFACSERTTTAPIAVSPAEATLVTPEVIEVAQALALFAAKAVPVDANGEGTRSEYGVIPGAKLLSSSSNYDCDKELPTDKDTPLVFYCGSTHCSASDTAAERALANGYKDVKVMRPGIIGWKDAGQKTVKPAT